MNVRIAIADEHTIIRRGVHTMIVNSNARFTDATSPFNLTVAGEAASTNELLTLLAQEKPDILLLGYTLIASLNDMEGLTLVKWLAHHYPTLKVMILSPDTNPLMIRLALEAGARAYLSRHTSEKVLRQALQSVIEGEVFVEHALMNTLFQKGKTTTDALSPRETEVLRLICKGLNLTDISRRMHLSIKTVSAHKMRAMEKLGVKNGCQLYCLLAKTRMFDIVL